MKEKDDQEEYKKRIRAMIDKVEKGEDFDEVYKHPIDSKSDISEEDNISDLSTAYPRDRIFNPNPRIRTNVIKELINHHPDKSIQIITEVLTQENSLYVFANIWRDLESAENEEYHILLNRFLAKFSKLVYNLDLNEVKFLLDLSTQSLSSVLDYGRDPSFENFYLHTDYGGLGTYNLSFGSFRGENLPSIKINPTTIHHSYLHNTLSTDTIDWISIYRGHISGLIAYNPLPESIRYLKRLKFLHIGFSEGYTPLEKDIPRIIIELKSLKSLSIHNFNIGKLPDFLGKLPKLQYLSLRGTNLDFIPQWVKNKAKKYHSRVYKKEGVADNDAFVLGLLEILLGEKISNLDSDLKLFDCNEEDYFHHGALCYNMNKNGNVTEIYILGWVNPLDIRILPEEILLLNALEILDIREIPNLRVVPDSIIKKFPYLGPVIFKKRIDEIKETEFLEENFLALLDKIDDFPDNLQYHSFSHLIASIKSTKILNRFFSQIKTRFLTLLNRIVKLNNLDQNRSAFYTILKVAEETGWIEEHFIAFLETIDKFPDPNNKKFAYSHLVGSIKRMNIDLSQIKNALVKEKISALPLYNDFIKKINSMEPSKVHPSSMLGKAEGGTPFQLNEAGAKQFVLDGLLNQDTEAQDYAKDVWSIMGNSQLTEKEKMDLVRKRLAKFEDVLERRKQEKENSS